MQMSNVISRKHALRERKRKRSSLIKC